MIIIARANQCSLGFGLCTPTDASCVLAALSMSEEMLWKMHLYAQRALRMRHTGDRDIEEEVRGGIIMLHCKTGPEE
ncbi:hypothetical protein PYCCODRAFT_556316 [Trametes coccinea BRFM310]|uniref:Uncharacterized protein n=1 Tax=Trametes coccinea (strain BRFM310) TaxID=1353009 RepID=A0A1Y2ILV9_TRAC3|nr:hypothetical protein PYCCODRAFT_556316 [Trametes coccinea BRFM310]